MDQILGVTIGLSMLFGFALGYRVGKQVKSKEILEAISRPTQYAPDVANAAPEEEALLILNECVEKLSRITRHAGNT